MALIETWIKTDLKSIISAKYIRGNLFSQDNMANLIGVELLENGEPANVSGTVTANVLRADGTTVAVAGTLSGNLASVTLPQAAYAVPGTVAIAIKLTTGSTVTTIGAIQAIVYRTSSDTIIDPGTIIPSVQDLIAAIDAAVDSIPPDYSALTAEVGSLKSAISDINGVISKDEIIFQQQSLAVKQTTSLNATYAASGQAVTSTIKFDFKEGIVYSLSVKFNSAGTPKPNSNGVAFTLSTSSSSSTSSSYVIDNIWKQDDFGNVPNILFTPSVDAPYLRYFTRGNTNDNFDIDINITEYKKETVTDLINAIGTKETELIGQFSSASYWSKEAGVGGTAEVKSAASYMAYSAIEVVNGKSYKAYIWQGTSTKQDPVVIADEDYKILKTYRGTNSQYNTFEFEVTDADAKYVLLTSYGNHDNTFKRIDPNSVPDIWTQVVTNTADIADIESDIGNITKEAITEGKYVSILGDSISALAGTIPSGNEAYYTGNNYGITSANDMWWKIVADTLGMNVLVNNSWSGSQVCDRTPGAKIPASYPARCQALHDSSHDPDYVLIAMGVNDYSYNSYLGDWNGQTMPVDDVDFTQSYALMINRIHSAYPNANIICISPWFVQRGTDTGVTFVNSQAAHLTESAYGDVIRKLCGMLGVIYIDGNVGFNKYNYYPTYCEDDETTPTHPNKAGQTVMGKVIAEKVRNLIY